MEITLVLSNSQEWEKIGQVGEARIPLLRSAVHFRLRFITAESEDFQRSIIVLLFSFWCAIFFLNAQAAWEKQKKKKGISILSCKCWYLYDTVLLLFGGGAVEHTGS